MSAFESPYSPPESPLENTGPPPGHSLSPRALACLAASGKWMKAAGILLGIAVLVHVAALIVTAVEWWGTSVTTVVSSFVLGLSNAAMIGWVLQELFRSVRFVREACADGSDAEVALALRAHRRFWTRLGMGILILFGISMAGVLVISAIAR